jgi:hypothetical protein
MKDTTLGMLFRSLIFDKVPLDVDNLPCLISISDFFICPEVRDEALLVLLDYIDKSNCYFFYKWSEIHSSKENSKWEELNLKCYNTMKDCLMNVLNKNHPISEFPFLSELPVDLSNKLLSNEINEIYLKISNSADLELEEILFKFVKLFQFSESSKTSDGGPNFVNVPSLIVHSFYEELKLKNGVNVVLSKLELTCISDLKSHFVQMILHPTETKKLKFY